MGTGVFTGNCEAVVAIPDTTGIFSGFQGLPTINNEGAVAFRADLKGGGQGIMGAKADRWTLLPRPEICLPTWRSSLS